MSRKNKILRAFLHQNQNPTIKQAWDAAWKHAQKTYHAQSMQDMGNQIADLQDECEKLRTILAQASEFVFEPDRDCNCQDCVDAASLLCAIDAVMQEPANQP